MVVRFEGIRILPKGSTVFREDFPPAQADVVASSERLKAPYILDAYNPSFKQSTMLAWNLGDAKPNAFNYEALPIYTMPDGEHRWRHNSLPLTEDEQRQAETLEYRIIDGEDVYDFLKDAAKREYVPVDFVRVRQESLDFEKQLPDAIQTGKSWELQFGWHSAMKSIAKQAAEMLLEKKWFRQDKSLGVKIADFIGQKNQLAAVSPGNFAQPVQESEPKAIMLAVGS